MVQLKLDLQFFAGEKTEKATPKKREDSRKKGQVAKSQDVNTAIILFSVFLFFTFYGSKLRDIALSIYKHTFQSFLLVDLTEQNVQMITSTLLRELVMFLGPIMLVAAIAAIVANYIQVGFLFSTEAIHFKLEKIDPVKGFKRIFSIRAIVELFKSILKISFVGAAAFSVILFRIDEILILSQKTIGAAIATLGSLTVQMGLVASIALLFLAVLDYFYQRYDYEKNIRMSKQDIKDEYKNIEGDPLIKSKIKQTQREMAMRRMMQEVPEADVVITNPTHFAIALKYDESKAEAPFVVAKGVNFLALKIKKTAEENGVVTVENKPLARALYYQVEIGQIIPDEFFKAVAEILAYVYRLKEKV